MKRVNFTANKMSFFSVKFVKGNNEMNLFLKNTSVM